MTQFVLGIKVSSKCSQNARRELEQLDKKGLWFGWSDVEALQLKDFKYIPMIIYTGHYICDSPLGYKESFIGFDLNLPLPYYEEVYKLFNFLRKKIKVRIVRAISARGKRALWPCEILDSKKMQDEINRLATQPLLSKNDPQDIEIAKRLLRWFSNRESTPEEKISYAIEVTNQFGKEFGDFFTKTLEIHKKHPKAKFWFSLEVL